MRRKRTFRTSVAIAMALCMVAMLFPASAYAEKSGETVGGGTITTETDIAGKIGATPQQTNETNNPAETGTAPQTNETKSPAVTGTMPQKS